MERNRSKMLPRVMNLMMIGLMGLAIASIAGLPWILDDYLDYTYQMTGSKFVTWLFLASVYLCGLLALHVLYRLKAIFKSCVNGDPFVMENVKALKAIAVSAFAIGAVFLVKAVFLATFLTLAIIFVFVLAGLFCLVLADVFEVAVSYKLENDLTI